MQLQIITPEEVIFSGEVDSVSLPGKNGRFQVLNNHAPVVSTLTNGNVVFEVTNSETVSERVQTQGKVNTFEINGGVIELNHNQMILLAD